VSSESYRDYWWLLYAVGDPERDYLDLASAVQTEDDFERDLTTVTEDAAQEARDEVDDDATTGQMDRAVDHAEELAGAAFENEYEDPESTLHIRLARGLTVDFDARALIEVRLAYEAELAVFGTVRGLVDVPPNGNPDGVNEHDEMLTWMLEYRVGVVSGQPEVIFPQSMPYSPYLWLTFDGGNYEGHKGVNDYTGPSGPRSGETRWSVPGQHRIWDSSIAAAILEAHYRQYGSRFQPPAEFFDNMALPSVEGWIVTRDDHVSPWRPVKMFDPGGFPDGPMKPIGYISWLIGEKVLPAPIQADSRGQTRR